MSYVRVSRTGVLMHWNAGSRAVRILPIDAVRDDPVWPCRCITDEALLVYLY